MWTLWRFGEFGEFGESHTARVRVTDESWQVAGAGPRLHLVRVSPPLLDALARGEDTSALPGGALVSEYLAGPECRRLWRFRSAQVAGSAHDSLWITRFIVVDGVPRGVGVAGFHGPPDASGMVEVGYRVDPAHRRRGYARRALETLLAVASDDPRVRTVRATISPDNVASRALVDQYGFAAVGEQWDEEDGLEIIFEAGS